VAVASSILPKALNVDSTLDRTFRHGQKGAKSLIAVLTAFNDVTCSEREQDRWHQRCRLMSVFWLKRRA
jgi:hypothetical protein